MSVSETLDDTAPSRRSRSSRSAGTRGAGGLRLLRSELRLIVGRRRNQMGLLVLAAVPVLLAIVMKTTASGEGGGPDLVSAITSNGLFVPIAALTAEITLFLPLAIAMLAGDAIAGEANQGTLRYLLLVPVSRTRLLVVKYGSLVIGSFIGVFTVGIVGAVVGLALFGGGPLLTFSGFSIGFTEALGRLVLMLTYVSLCLCGLAALGLFVSTLTEQPMAATVAVMIVTVVSWILESISQLAWLHPWLLVHDWPAFIDLLREPPYWANMSHGLLVAAGYTVVFWLAAWARFSSKDVTS